MRPDAWRRVDEVLQKALLLSPEQRTDFLDRACGDDAHLRREVESLLAADARSGAGLDHPTSWMSDQLSAGVRPGTRLGPYRLGERVGEGGMSVVYEGRRDDQRYERRVAVKFLRDGLPSSDTRARFEGEGRILASLDHPHIARLHDVGRSDTGWPYLVMEFVDGQRIDRYCQEHDLSIDQRLDLFLQVCSAVRYAHQNLVIHRDLKPSNILVTLGGYNAGNGSGDGPGEATVKLLDFGIAKLLDADAAAGDLTLTRRQPMTPQYASPEQLKGERPTLATDVYSLGVLLFQLLTDQLPHAIDNSLDSVHRFLANPPPVPRPSSTVRADNPRETARRQKEISGDLDNIVRKALARDTSERYVSVEELSEDLRRYRDGLPVRARRPTAGYRLTKFVGRHRVAVAGGVGLAFLILAFAATMAFLASEVRTERDTASRERDAAQEVSGILVDLFALADPAETRSSTITARELLERGEERMDRDLKDQPEARARLQDALGRAYLELGLLDRAKPLLEGSLAYRRRTSDEDPLALASSLSILSELEYEQASDLEQAERLVREAVALWENGLPENDPVLLQGRIDLGSILERQGRHQEALEIATEGTERLRQVLGDGHWRVGEALALQAQSLTRLGRPREAIGAAREALRKIRQRGEDHPSTLTATRHLAGLLRQVGDLEEARAMNLQVLEIQKRVLGDQHLETAYTLNSLALVETDLGNLEEAEGYARAGLESRTEILGANHLATAASLAALAHLLTKQGRAPEAVPLAERAVAIARGNIPAGSPTLAFPLVELGRIQLVIADPGAAEASFREALTLVEQGLPPGHSRIYSARRDLGKSLAAQGRQEEAEALWRGILSAAPDSPQADDVRELMTLGEAVEG